MQADSTIHNAVQMGAGEKAFCAGGDIKFLSENGKDQALRSRTSDFFRSEYTLNYMLATSPLPIVSILNGMHMPFLQSKSHFSW